MRTVTNNANTDSVLEQSQRDGWLRAKVEASRADTRPTIPQAEVAARLRARLVAASIRNELAER